MHDTVHSNMDRATQHALKFSLKDSLPSMIARLVFIKHDRTAHDSFIHNRHNSYNISLTITGFLKNLSQYANFIFAVVQSSKR